MNKENQIISIRLAHLLASNYGYEVIRLDPTTHDISMVNMDHSHYPTIHIRLSPIDLAKDKSAMMVESINQMNRDDQKLQLLSLSFVDENKDYETHHITHLDSQNQFDTQVLNVFPKLSELNWIINNPDQDLKQAVDKLNQSTVTQRNKKVKRQSFTQSKGAITIIVICVLVHILGMFISSMTPSETTYMIFLGGLYVPFIQGAYEVTRFITAGFVHASLSHLFVNMMSLYNISILLEKVYGTKKFITVLLLSIIGGNLFVYIGDTQAVISVGMSTGIYGLLGLFFVYLFETGLIKSPLFQRQLMIIVGLNLIINFLPNISWLGHLGGFVTGVIIAVLYSKKPTWQHIKKHTLIASLIFTLALGYLVINRQKPTNIFLGSDNEVIEVARKLNLDFYGDYLQDRLSKYYFEGVLQ